MKPYLSLKITEFLTRSNALLQQLQETTPPREYLAVKRILEQTIQQAIRKVEPLTKAQEISEDFERGALDRVAEATVIFNDACFYYARYCSSLFRPSSQIAAVRLVNGTVAKIPALSNTLNGKILLDPDEQFAAWLPRRNLLEPLALICVLASESLSLLSFPILGHEIGHLLVYLHGNALLADFRQVLNQFVQTRYRQVRGQSSQAIQKETEYLRRLKTLWSRWTVEIACDITGLHLFGAYFIRSMQQIFIGGGNPFQITESHPPHHLRVQIMLNLLQETEGWTDEISSIRLNWQALIHNYSDPGDYDIYAIPEITQACVKSILSGLEQLGLSIYIPDFDLDEKVDHDTGLSLPDAVTIVWQEFLQTSLVPLQLEKKLIETLTRVKLD